MVTESEKLDHWRKYFRNANSDIFDVIEHAILVAATDCPKEFRTQRARIVENLFSCRLARCSGCDHVELQMPDREDQTGELQGKENEAEKDNKINRVTNVREDANSVVTTLSYDEAKALTEEIEEESQTTREVLRIKEIIVNQDDQSEAELFDSLRRLQLMTLSFGTLDETGIGKAVNCLRKHRAKRIRQIVHALIDAWKVTVDEWLRTTAVIAESTPDSVNSSYTVVEEEEGLLSPPLDAGAFFPIGMDIELSQIFDCMDEDGNLCISGELDENGENGRKPEPENCSKPPRKQQITHNGELEKEGENGRKLVPENPSKPIRRPQSSQLQLSIPDNNSQIRKQDAINKQSKQQETLDKPIKRQEVFNKPIKQGEAFHKPIKQQETFNKNTTHSVTNSGSGPGRPLRPQEPAFIHKKPQDNCKYSEEPEDGKLEAAKRRLQEGYLLAESAKKQRTIQIMELHDLPKQGLQRQSHPKQGFQNRRWANGRH